MRCFGPAFRTQFSSPKAAFQSNRTRSTGLVFKRSGQVNAAFQTFEARGTLSGNATSQKISAGQSVGSHRSHCCHCRSGRASWPVDIWTRAPRMPGLNMAAR